MLEESFYGKPREVQLTALRKIEEAIKQGYHNIVISAPTGTGKSFIATALALHFKEGDILTATVNLQKQYLRDFPFLKSVMGRKNFKCYRYHDGRDCSKVPAVVCRGNQNLNICRCMYYPSQPSISVRNKGLPTEIVTVSNVRCDYYNQKIAGLNASFRIFNYHEYFTILLRDMKNKDRLSKVLLVCDEAHMLEDMVTGFYTLEIDDRLLNPLGISMDSLVLTSDDITVWLSKIADIKRAYKLLITKTEYELERLNGDREDNDNYDDNEKRMEKERINIETICLISKKLARYEETYNRLSMVYEAVCSNKDNFIVEIKTNSNNKGNSISSNNSNSNNEYKVKIIPLNASYFLKSVFDRVQYRIFMSATINYPLLMKVTGLEEEDTTFIELPSTFLVENRRILLLNRYSLNRDSMQDEGVMKRVAEEVEAILNKHPIERGLILTTSYYLAEQIYSNCISKRNRLLLAKGLSMEEIMEKHLSTSNSVIITPSMWEGVDLKDDLCRFIIIVKTPYPDLSDKRTAVLATKDREWYELHTISRLIQGSGRGVRHDKDYCITYVLDSNVSWLLKRRKYKDKDIPAWFREAIVWNGSSSNNDSNGSNRHIARTVTTSRLEDLFR